MRSRRRGSSCSSPPTATVWTIRQVTFLPARSAGSYVDDAGDQVFDASISFEDQSYDTVYATVDFSAADVGTEILVGVGDRDFHLAGGECGTSISSGAGNDTLAGGAFEDRLRGGAGDDVLIGGDGFDVIDGGDGDDTITAYSGQITGGAGDDTIQLAGGVPNFPFRTSVDGGRCPVRASPRGRQQEAARRSSTTSPRARCSTTATVPQAAAPRGSFPSRATRP